jgi:hypothetical protein
MFKCARGKVMTILTNEDTEVLELTVTTKKLAHKTNGTFAVEIKVEGLPTAKMRDELTKALEHGILAFFNEDEEVKSDDNK